MKRFVLLGLILLLAIPASAQVAFQVTSLPRQVRGEGVTETVGDVLLTALNNGNVLIGSTINIVYGATVTAAGSTGATVTLGDNVMVAQGGFAIPGTMTSALSGAQITISFGATTAFTTGQGFTIGNIRADATGYSSGGTITAYISGVSANPGTNPITFTQPSVVVGLVTKPSMTATGITTPFTTILTCSGLIAPGTNSTALVVKEVFPSAFTSRVDERAFTGSIPAASITNGTLIQVTLSGVPSGLVVTLTPSVYNTGTAVASGTTVAISRTAATSTANVATIVAAATATAATTNTNAGADVVFTIAFGDTTTATKTSVIEDLSIVFNAVMAAPIAALTSPPTITAKVELMPTLSTAIDRFAATTLLTTTTVGAIGNCTSMLLFPYAAANVAGFDTSIAIANTTLDVMVPAANKAAAQPGACTLTGFPTPDPSAPGTVGTAVTLTTPTIAAGGTYAASLGSTTAFSGFIGYIFASCNFLNAHGFAFVTNGFGGTLTISHGYLPLIVNPNATRVVPAGESLNN
jgi:hypothetical protein